MGASTLTKTLFGTPVRGIRGALLRYGVALLAVTAAAAGRFWLEQFFGVTPPYVIFYPAVMIVAMVAGLGPGLLATALSASVAEYFFLQSRGSLTTPSPDNKIGLALFVLVGVGISALADVMDRRAAELRRSKAELDRAQSVARIGSWYLDIPGSVLTWSDETYRIFQVPMGTPITEEGFLRQVHPDDRQPLLDAWSAAVIRKNHDFEHRILVGDEIKWVRERAQIELDADGKPISATGTVQDITDRKRSEMAQELLASIITSSSAAIASGTLDGIVTSWNPGAEAMYGYTAEEMIGKSIYRVVPPGLSSEIVETAERGRRGERALQFETVRTRKDGSRIDVSRSTSPIFDHTGRVIGISLIAHDISERKRAEEKLRASEERLRLAQRVAGIGTFDWDVQTGLSRWTPELERLYGLTPGTFDGRPETFLNLIHPQDRARVAALLQEADRTGEGEGEWRVVWPDGTVRWLASRWGVSKDEGGKPDRAFGINLDITERKRAEEKSRKTEVRLQLQIDRMPIGCIVWDKRIRVTQWNPAAERIFGFTAEEVMGRHPSEFMIPAGTRPQLEAIISKLVHGDTTVQSTNRNLTKSGRRISCQWTNTPLKEPDGTLVGVLSMVEDVTERKRNDYARELLASIVTSTSDAIISETLEGKITSWNSGAEAIYGYQAKEMIGQSVACLIPPDRSSEFSEILEKTTKPAQTIHLDTVRLRKDGSRVDVSLTVSPIRNRIGGVIGISVIGHDITERKRAEEQVRKASRYTRRLIEASPDPLLTISPDGKITDANFATETVTGLSRERLIGSDFCNYFTEPEQARKAYEHVFEQETVRDYPLAIRDIFGRLTHVLYNASVFRNEAGEVEGVFAVARDISERRILEEQLLQAQKLEAIGQFAGGIAHDFNNLMSVILGYAGLIQERLSPGHALMQPVEHIRRAADRASGVTRRLLAFSRKQVMRPKLFSINDLVAEVSKMLARFLGENIEVLLKLSPDLARVKADPVQIEQVLMNLAVNARDAMPTGGTLTIATENVELDHDYQKLHAPIVPGSYVMFSVSDTGIGMSEETRSHLFEPFFTTKGMGEGTGLGLSIVYGVVKQSGGNIWVHSEEGQGTIFKVYLPAHAAAEEMELKPEPQMKPPIDAGTILLVEDEAALAELAQEVLEREGYAVMSAGTAEEALQLARSHPGPVQLLLTDVILRGRTDGIDLAAQLTKERPEIKVLFMSGYSDALTSSGRRFDPHLVLLEKPFSPASLCAKVSEVLSTGAPTLARRKVVGIDG
jgi:two-component system, cell cycle sensor histidine kinase and response regulator CckA